MLRPDLAKQGQAAAGVFDFGPPRLGILPEVEEFLVLFDGLFF
jgi:hypothetical protein